MAMTDDGIAAAAASLTIAAMNLLTSTTKISEPDAASAVDLVTQIYRNMVRVVKDAPDKSPSQKGTMDLSGPTA